MTASNLHVCAPSDAAVFTLRKGNRSSVREACSCGRLSTWMMKNSGAIVALNLEARRRK